jgi:hypothetical protein
MHENARALYGLPVSLDAASTDLASPSLSSS